MSLNLRVLNSKIADAEVYHLIDSARRACGPEADSETLILDAVVLAELLEAHDRIEAVLADTPENRAIIEDLTRISAEVRSAVEGMQRPGWMQSIFKSPSETRNKVRETILDEQAIISRVDHYTDDELLSSQDFTRYCRLAAEQQNERISRSGKAETTASPSKFAPALPRNNYSRAALADYFEAKLAGIPPEDSRKAAAIGTLAASYQAGQFGSFELDSGKDGKAKTMARYLAFAVNYENNANEETGFQTEQALWEMQLPASEIDFSDEARMAEANIETHNRLLAELNKKLDHKKWFPKTSTLIKRVGALITNGEEGKNSKKALDKVGEDLEKARSLISQRIKALEAYLAVCNIFNSGSGRAHLKTMAQREKYRLTIRLLKSNED